MDEEGVEEKEVGEREEETEEKAAITHWFPLLLILTIIIKYIIRNV